MRQDRYVPDEEKGMVSHFESIRAVKLVVLVFIMVLISVFYFFFQNVLEVGFF